MIEIENVSKRYGSVRALEDRGGCLTDISIIADPAHFL